MAPTTDILNVPVAAFMAWTWTDDNWAAENDTIVVIDDIFTLNDTNTALIKIALAATLEAKAESLFQLLWSEDDEPNREVRAETLNKPKLPPNNVMDIDPEQGLSTVSIKEILTEE